MKGREYKENLKFVSEGVAGRLLEATEGGVDCTWEADRGTYHGAFGDLIFLFPPPVGCGICLSAFSIHNLSVRCSCRSVIVVILGSVEGVFAWLKGRLEAQVSRFTRLILKNCWTQR